MNQTPRSALPQTGVTYADLIVEALTRNNERTAFIDADRSVTYAEVADLTSRIRQVLATRGITRNGCIGALSVNAPEVWMTQAATALSGARYTGLHPMGSVDDHIGLCDDAEVTVLVVHPKFAEAGQRIADGTPGIEHLLTLGPAEFGEDLLALAAQITAEPLDRGPAEEEDIAWLQYTGGTTGIPKGVMISHRAMVQEVYSLTASWQLPLEPRTLLATPITHASVLPLLPTLLRGGTVVLQQGFVPDAWLEAVQTHKVNYVFTIPTLLYALMDHGHIDAYDLSSLETVVYGASPMSPSRIEEAIKAFGPKLLQAYGQTECTGMSTTLMPHEHDPVDRPELLSSCGRPVTGARVELLDEAGQIVAPGSVGEICVRSRAVMSGYWKRPEETAVALDGGWLHTSDMAYRDETGFLHIVDRKKDMVVSGGFNIYPREIEDVLTEDPSVSAAAVIGVPDVKWGEAIKAFVVLKPGETVDVASLIARVKERKGSHCAPKSLDVVESLPQTAVGKIDKKVLRAPYWSDSERSVN